MVPATVDGFAVVGEGRRRGRGSEAELAPSVLNKRRKYYIIFIEKGKGKCSLEYFTSRALAENRNKRNGGNGAIKQLILHLVILRLPALSSSGRPLQCPLAPQRRTGRGRGRSSSSSSVEAIGRGGGGRLVGAGRGRGLARKKISQLISRTCQIPSRRIYC